MFKIINVNKVIYNYPPKGRLIVVDIYRDAKGRGIYPPLFTDPEGDSCFSIYQIIWIKKTLLQFLLLKLSRNDAPFFSPSQNSEFPRIFQVMGANQTRENCYPLILVNNVQYLYLCKDISRYVSSLNKVLFCL